MLTLEEFCEAFGLKYHGVYHAVRRGAVRPEVPGRKGRGCRSLFSHTQCVAMAVAFALIASPRSCSAAYRDRVARSLCETDRRWLEGQLGRGVRYFIGLKGNVPVMTDRTITDEAVDVAEANVRVAEAIKLKKNRAEAAPRKGA